MTQFRSKPRFDGDVCSDKHSWRLDVKWACRVLTRQLLMTHDRLNVITIAHLEHFLHRWAKNLFHWKKGIKSFGVDFYSKTCRAINPVFDISILFYFNPSNQSLDMSSDRQREWRLDWQVSKLYPEITKLTYIFWPYPPDHILL